MSSGDAEGGSGAGEGGSILLNQPIVLDNGTGSVKAGFAGGSKPKVSRVIGSNIAYCGIRANNSHMTLLFCNDRLWLVPK